jgi:hypothetical protein
MGHQGLLCANLGEIVEKAKALNAEGAKVKRKVSQRKAKADSLRE